MNSLSWMIYLADVVGGLDAGAFVLSIFSAVALGGTLLSTIPMIVEEAGNDEWALWRKVLKASAAALAASCLVAVAVPSTNTIYAIAASEMGETALNSETGGKAVKALNAWLDRQIAGEKEAE